MAIARSPEVAAINERLELANRHVKYAERRRWTSYLTLDPLRLVQNILGGGAIQEQRLAIADLEIQAADLVRRRAEIAEGLAKEVVESVLSWERLSREIALLDSQIQTQQHRRLVLEAAYRTGQGSTTNMLGVWQRTDDLAAASREVRIEQEHALIRVVQLVGADEDKAWDSTAAAGDRPDIGQTATDKLE